MKAKSLLLPLALGLYLLTQVFVIGQHAQASAPAPQAHGTSHTALNLTA